MAACLFVLSPCSAGRLVVADASVTRDPGFAQISVTAEQWIPIEEVQGE